MPHVCAIDYLQLTRAPPSVVDVAEVAEVNLEVCVVNEQGIGVAENQSSGVIIGSEQA